MAKEKFEENANRLDEFIDEVAYGLYLEGEDLFKKGEETKAIKCLQLPHAYYHAKGDLDGMLRCENLVHSKGYRIEHLELNREENIKHFKNLRDMIIEVYTVSTN